MADRPYGPRPLPPMRRMTVAVTEIEYQVIQRRAHVYGRSQAREGGILISRALMTADEDDRRHYAGGTGGR